MKPILSRLLPLTAAAALLGSCNTQQGGTLLGAGSGAVLGAIAGNNVDGVSKTEGAVAGAVVGGVAGNQHGRQQEEINALKAANQTTIQVRNSNGSTTPVTLTKTPNGWQGPRGEFYADVPTSEQLRPVYGF